ncbi:MAG TPA: tetratricopeptide repeat protein [Planctomycetaceae bacterium]|nr:tetratricopeptide repeat protein [Planctomycetaceae bacterium]
MRRLFVLVGFLTIVSVLVWNWQLLAPRDGESLPKSPETRIELFYEALSNRDESAMSRIEQSFRDGPRSEDYGRFFQGLKQIHSGELEAALSSLHGLGTNALLRPFVIISIAETLYRLDRLNEAQVLLKGLLNEDEDHLDAHRLLGAILYDLGAYSRAIPYLEFVLERAPGSMGTHFMMGIIGLEFGDTTESIDHFQKVLEAGASGKLRQDAIWNLSDALMQTQKYAEAEGRLSEYDESSKFLSRRANCLWNLQRRDEARQLLKKAANIDDSNREYRLIQLQIQMHDRQWEQAAETAVQHLQTNPHDADVRYQLAQAYARQGRQEDFEREIARYEEASKLIAQLQELNRRATADARDPVIRDQLAEVCDRLGKKELAEMWRKAAEHCREAQYSRVRSQ